MALFHAGDPVINISLHGKTSLVIESVVLDDRMVVELVNDCVFSLPPPLVDFHCACLVL